MNEYELVYLIESDLPADKSSKIQEKVKKIFNDNQVEVLSEKDWGKRKLAYPINKTNFAQYFYLNYLSDGKCIKDVERILNLEESVLRFLTIKMAENVNREIADKRKRVTEAEEMKLKLDDLRPKRSEHPREDDAGEPKTGESNA